MQPLYSVDHETRNHNRAEEGNVERAEEHTPLLHHVPLQVPPRSTLTTVFCSLLLMILVLGVFIGIYLLVIQSDSENVLPPVERQLQLVSRSQWDLGSRHLSQSENKSVPNRLREVTVVQTGTEQCLSTKSCSTLLQEMQANGTLASNFLISSNGQTYEALGWGSTQKGPSGLLLAFIGNFTQVPPPQTQLEAVKNFLEASVSQKYLDPSYRIVGKNVKDTPLYLTQRLKDFPQWSSEFSDTITK